MKIRKSIIDLSLIKTRIARLKTLRSLLLAMLAFILAGFAQKMLSGSLKGYGWTLYLIAAALFVIAYGRVELSQFALGRLKETPAIETGSVLSRLGWFLVILSLLATAGSVILFMLTGHDPSAWYLHILSWLLFLAAVIPFNKFQRPPLLSRAKLSKFIIRLLPLGVVLALAVFARLWQIKQFPFGTWNDEAFNGLAAVNMLQDPNYRPVYIEFTNLPAHFIYLIALSFRLFGVSTLAMRYVTAAFGVITVVFAYLLFRRWFGEGIGLVAATVCAILRYDLTFSRIAMHGVSTPAFELIVLYFLDRALAERKVTDFAWLGLTLGLGLSFYAPFRLFPLVLASFVLGLFLMAVVRYGKSVAFARYINDLIKHWLIALLGLLIAVAPVAQFALHHPDQFFGRTKDISIFTRRDEPNLQKALWNNTIKHLEMFNIKGDRNGRHNLPEAPMLDPVMGVLLILGLGYALWRWRDPSNFLMLLVFIIMLQGGILTVDFEAPQALRSIGVISALLYFVTVPIAALTHSLRHIVDDTTRANPSKFSPHAANLAGGVLISLLLILVTYLNFNLFFNKQKNDPGVWAAYSTAETIVANEMNALGTNYDLILSARYDNHPTVRFLAGTITNHKNWTVNDRLPLVHDADRGVVLFFDGTLLSAYDEARRFYPNAEFRENYAPKGYSTDIDEIIIRPADLRAVSGIVAEYFKRDVPEGDPVKQEVLDQIAIDWTKAKPLSESFVAELRSTLHISDYGSYLFSLRGDAQDGKLWIDEYPVSDAPVTLARGNHALRIQVSSNSDKLELWWQPPKATEMQPVPAVNLFRPPVTNNGLLGTYYQSPDWSGEPAFTQIDPGLDYYFHVIPLNRPYSVQWTGKLFAPITGDYRFALDSIDNSHLDIDNKLVVDNPKGHTKIEGNITLTQGWHDIDVHFADKTGGTQIYLYWTPPGTGDSVLVPPLNLLPPMGQYPPTADMLSSAQP